MFTTLRHSLRHQLDRVRASAVVVLAIALMIGSVLLAVKSMAVDDEMRSHYEEALALSQLAVEAQQCSTLLRDHQARVARGLPLAQSREPEAAALESAMTRLHAKLYEIDGFRLSLDEENRLVQLKSGLMGIRNLNTRLIEATRSSEVAPDTGGQLAAQSQQRFEAFDQSLSELVAGVRLRTVSAARRADNLNLTARYTLIAFAAVTLALGGLSVLLTLRTLKENRVLLARMQQLTREDALTGAVNRRGLDDVLSIELSRAQRSDQPLSLVMIDLDHFKRYNDRRGHPAGDAVLRGAAQAWLKQLRPTDRLARYGGEEFMLVLPGTDADQAAQLVDRLRAPVPDRQTFSAGIAAWDGSETAADVMQRADNALLQAKKAGRNRSMVAGREPQVTLPLMVA